MPQMADCLVCHTDIDNPFSCEKCHAKDAQLKPASHVASFLSDHTSGKLNLDKASCVSLPRPELPLPGLSLIAVTPRSGGASVTCGVPMPTPLHLHKTKSVENKCTSALVGGLLSILPGGNG